MAFSLRASQSFSGLQSPGEDGPRCLLDFGIGMRTWRGEKGTASHRRRRDMKGEGEKRDQKSEAAAGGKKKKGSGRTRPLPKYPSRLPYRRPKTRAWKAFFAGGRGCKLCSKRCRGVPGEPSPQPSPVKRLLPHTPRGPCGALSDQKRSEFLLRWSLGRQNPIFSHFYRFFFSPLPGWLGLNSKPISRGTDFLG